MDGKWNNSVANNASGVGGYATFNSQRAVDNESLAHEPQPTNTSACGQYSMVNVGSSSFASIVTGPGRDGSPVPHSSYQFTNQVDQQEQPQPAQQQPQQPPEASAPEESNEEAAETSDSEENSNCFVCSGQVTDRTFECLKVSMNHSHAPLLVLLSDILGYKLEDAKLHSKVICKSCFHLLDIIDELQQTLTESKTDVRTKFLETIQRFKLKYPRTDKMLKPRCARCIQMTQHIAKKRGRGRGRSRSTDCARGRPRGSRARGRGRGGKGRGSDSEDEPNPNLMEVEPDITVDDEESKNKNAKKNKFEPNEFSVFDDDPEIFSPDEKLKVGQIVEDEGRRIFSCNYCMNNSDSARTLKVHVRVYHMPVLVYDSGQGQGNPETRYRMGIKLQNTTPNNIVKAEKPFACLFCESCYKLQSSLQSHFRHHHSPYKPHVCECKEAFRTPIELTRHRLYRCDFEKGGPYKKHRLGRLV